MQIHLLAQIPTAFAGVDEFARELEAEPDVVRASAPFPVTYVGHSAAAGHLWRLGVVTVVARARLDRTLGARARYRVRHGGAGDRIEKGGLTTSCKKGDKPKLTIIY